MDLGANSDTQWYCPPAVGALESIRQQLQDIYMNCPLRIRNAATSKKQRSKGKGKEKEKETTNIEATSANDAIMHSAPTMTPVVIQISPAVPPLMSPYCAASKTLSHVDCSTMTKPTMEMKRKFLRSSCLLPMRFML